MKYAKYHALGNDYIVLSPGDLSGEIAEEKMQRICHRNYGIGSDGILLGPLESASCDFGLRIFNPDGSEAEKSGNGLRIFARALWDQKRVGGAPFTVETPGGPVMCQVGAKRDHITVEMGMVNFHSDIIPVAGISREVLNERILVGDVEFIFSGATVGNPHCVVSTDGPTPAMAKEYGPLIEVDPRFPNRTNVQFMTVIDRRNIRIEIWERGAGYTLASGSSSTAAAAVANKLGLCDDQIAVHMPGGVLQIALKNDFSAVMTGPATKICEGTVSEEIFQWIPPFQPGN